MSVPAQSAIASRPRSSRFTSTTTASSAKLAANSSAAPVLTARKYVGDRPGQAQFLRELIDLRHRSPPFPTPLWQMSTDASKILFLSD